jgi:2-isopropylmalate synthase
VFNNPPGPDPANDVIYDWNLVDSFHQLHNKKVELLDETLRDGLQSAYVTHPHTGEKAELLRLMDAIGIDVADIGLPGASD